MYELYLIILLQSFTISKEMYPFDSCGRNSLYLTKYVLNCKINCFSKNQATFSNEPVLIPSSASNPQLMNTVINSIYFFILMFTKSYDVYPIAVTDTPEMFIHLLYRDERNEDRPSSWDPATTNVSAWLRVCEEITNSGELGNYGSEHVNMNEIIDEMMQPIYLDIFHHLREHRQSSNTEDSSGYPTPYRLRELELETLITDDNNNSYLRFARQIIKEYVLTCPLKLRELRGIIPYYVSKAYNPPYARRFVFPIPESHLPYTSLKLVERSAKAYTKQDFSVELHYLQLRKYHQPAQNVDVDPICKFNSRNVHEDQTIRLCNIVLTSSYFKNKVSYPHRIYSGTCIRRLVSFGTAEAIEESGQTPFEELFLRCTGKMIDRKDSPVFYVSRAYNSNEVLVYDDTFRLQVLLTLVGVVHEPYNFGKVEI